MIYRLINTFSDEVIEVCGQPLPSLCVVEDDGGVRMLLVDHHTFLASLWDRGLSEGVSGLLWPIHRGVNFLSRERFEEGRIEHPGMGTYEAPERMWTLFEQGADYRTMLGRAMDADEQVPLITNPFVHLHTHTEFSRLDGVSLVEEIVTEVAKDGQGAVGITDHGTCGAHPYLQAQASKAGIKPIFGIEAYFVDDRRLVAPSKPKLDDSMSPEQKLSLMEEWERQRARARAYNHLILWAMNDVGLVNLWAASTEANREGFYYHPRLDWDTLARHSEGVMCSTACLRGPLAPHILADDEEGAVQKVGRLLSIFDGRLYFELGANHLEEQRKVNLGLLDLSQRFSVPTIIAVDSHYPCVDDKEAHAIWIAAQTNKDLQDEADLFGSGDDYHIMGVEEVRKSLDYLPAAAVEEAISNCTVVADRCDAKLKGSNAVPIFSKQGGADSDKARLVDLCLAQWDRKTMGKRESQEVYEQRFVREMDLIARKEFCGYFMIVADYCSWAKDNGIFVGPGRGSGGGCLVAYLCGITEMDPVEHDLLFERFLTEGRTELPDFDVDFPASKRGVMTDYIIRRWGEENVVRVGTNIRFKNKGIVRSVAKVLSSTYEIDYRDTDAVASIIDKAEAGTAGLGMDWDDLWVQYAEELDPYRQKYPEMYRYCDRLVGRISTSGKHAAGMVISTDASPLIERLPMRAAGEKEDRQMVADFDMRALADLGLVKFDILTLRTLDTIQECIDLIKARRGDVINVYDWDIEYKDPQVWGEISDGRTMGIFQIETPDGTRLTRRFRPQSLEDLADIGTLVRPGPTRSGLTKTYFRRRSGEEPITYPDPRLEEALGKTLGCIVYQEDIMKTCMVLAGYNGEEADNVRSILGKKKVDKIATEAARFIPACVERGMPEAAVEALWAQMAEFAKYTFNRAHAFAYAVIGYWTAWFKFHYPVEFFTAALSTVDNDRIPDFVKEARRMGFKVLPPDINESRRGFTPYDLTIRYGFEGVKGLGPAATDAIVSGQPYASWDDFRARKPVDSGKVLLLARVGAFDSLVPNRHQLVFELQREASGEATTCIHKDGTALGPNGLPCVFDWSSEPVELTPKGRPKKGKPVPKRCTKGCRNYTPPPRGMLTIDPYTDADIRGMEYEILGIYLSSTPFDRIPAKDLEMLHTGEEVSVGPDGEYTVAGLLTKVRPYVARNGKPMGFIGLYAQDGDVDVTVFSSEWTRYKRDFVKDALVLAVIIKKGGRCHLVALMPVP